MTKLLQLLLASGTIILCSNCREVRESSHHQFGGLYKLHIMEQRDSLTSEWHEWRNGMQGYILYDGKGHMAVHLTTKGYENTDLTFPNFNDTIAYEALQYLTNSYVYFANYKVNEQEGTVEHARISHSNPSEWNSVVLRNYRFSGDTLILQPAEQANANLRLKWIRESD